MVYHGIERLVRMAIAPASTAYIVKSGLGGPLDMVSIFPPLGYVGERGCNDAARG
jgi:hypothetical protein